ncbi:AMP-binding protein [Halomonas gomseomensis]|uniref:AMP-binding protein n=1 Tax=Vreelandella gomseomensis TaxID=370766 RepID=A0ABU1GEV4_9GAMM|nr:AMP-binding protein [Halomonas gomseomensis]MDR5876022.1 AMP-binding protein [Halomonas gomseomensis]
MLWAFTICRCSEAAWICHYPASIKIVAPDSFEELPTGEAGMILISGPQVMLGYLNDPTRQDDVIKELDEQRWFVTGDKGFIDEDGFLTLIAR